VGAIVNPDAVVVNGALVGTALARQYSLCRAQCPDAGRAPRYSRSRDDGDSRKDHRTLKATSDWVDNDDARGVRQIPPIHGHGGSGGDRGRRSGVAKGHDLPRPQSDETKLSDRVALETGLVYSHVASENSGKLDHPLPARPQTRCLPPPPPATSMAAPRSTLRGQHIFLKLTPNPNWLADVGFRDESNLVTSQGGFMTTALATGAEPPSPPPTSPPPTT